MRLTQRIDYALRSFRQYLDQHTLAAIRPTAPDPAATHAVRVRRPARAWAS
jgi:hypothetical protein